MNTRTPIPIPGPGAPSACILVWYRVDPQRGDECRRLQQRLHARVLARWALHGRFGWRDEPGKNRRTWLESWDPVSLPQVEEFVRTLEADARELGLQELAQDGRFVDVFEWSANHAGAEPECA